MANMSLVKRFSLLCLIALLVIGFVFGKIITYSLEQSMKHREELVTGGLIAEEVMQEFTAKDFIEPVTGKKYEELKFMLDEIALGPHIQRIKIWNTDSTILWAGDRRIVGLSFPDNNELQAAIGGTIHSEISTLTKTEHEFETGFEHLMELYIPISFGNNRQIDIVFEIYKNLDPLYIDIYKQKKIVWLSTFFGLLILYILLYSIVSRASKKIYMQTADIKRKEEKYRSLVRSAKDGIINIDKSCTMVLNESAEKIFGYSSNELNGRPLSDIIYSRYIEHCEVESENFFDAANSRLIGRTIGVEGITKSGSLILIELSVSVSGTGDYRLLTLILRDISERITIQQRLILAEKQESIAVIAGSIGHELNNICSGFLGYSELLIKRPEDLELAQKCARVFETQSQRLKMHAHNLLSLSKPRKAQMRVLSLNDQLDRVTDLLNVSGLLKSFTIVKEYSKETPTFNGDEMLIEQVIRNLEINAAHAMGSQGVLSVKTVLSGDSKTVELYITDTGHGIPADMREKIFVPFYTTKADGKGTGLGMYIVKQIVEQHKGTIAIESTEGVGTTICISLPASR